MELFTAHTDPLEKLLSLFIRAGHKAKIVGDSIHVTYESNTQFVGLTVAGAAIQMEINLKISRTELPKKVRGGKCDILVTIKKS